MNAKKPYGKGLSGFIFGLLLATLVIAGILFFLNKSNKEAFKQQTPRQEPKTEVLVPKDSSTVVPPMPEPENEETVPLDSGVSQQTSSAEITPATPAKEKDELGDFIKEQQKQDAVQQHETAPAPDSHIVTPAEKPTVKPATPTKTEPQLKSEVKVEKQAEKPAKPAPKADKSAAAEKAPEPKQPSKPTPEQILNSGNIEKARKEAAKAAPKAATPTAKTADSTTASSGSRVILQMGSFGDRASADAQRAKLAMLGVSANVVQATANGKTVYRVQSGRLSQADASRLKGSLQQHGVDSFSRAVK